MAECLVFFRNDDVNRMEPGLVEVTDLLQNAGAVISHAVEPANLTEEVRNWLLGRAGRGVEVIQHGYAHLKHDVGEFGGTRSRSAQEQDLAAGLKIMEDAFGDVFFRAMSFPFGGYNSHTMELIDQLNYKVVSCAWRHRARTQAFYRVGRLLGKGRWLGRHIPYHLGHYPGTRLAEISVTISPIASYHGASDNRSCRFWDQAVLRKMFQDCRGLSPVIGIVLHHRFHSDTNSLNVLADFLGWMRDQPGVRFVDIESVYRERNFG